MNAVRQSTKQVLLFNPKITPCTISSLYFESNLDYSDIVVFRLCAMSLYITFYSKLCNYSSLVIVVIVVCYILLY